MRRVLSRAAVIVGGAAAAWLLSTATASAQSSEPDDAIKPVVDALTVAAPVDSSFAPQDAQQFKDFVDTVLPAPQAPSAELEEVGRRVRDTVGKVAAHLSLPAPRTESGETTPARLRILTPGDESPVVTPVAAIPQLVPVVTPGPERVAAHDVRRASVAESPRLAPSAGDPAPELPALPRLPMPMPLPAPAAPAGACSSCGTSGSNDDFGIAGAHAWPFPASGSATSQALRLISQHVSPAAGAQPGVTPD
ncbi:hypothetical protein KIPE111705_16280 [Kibdelosporangium persicum]|uniref:hypothetical protein n=1 Tax=Kibdelosporangium persicum TaxID=2698649 RepID=UPI00156485A2|nr:hypothetical protein [Kibdelosporangium persicum]